MPEKAQEGPSLVAQVWLARPPHHREMGGGLVGQGRTAGDSPAHMLLPAGLEKAARPDGPVLLLHQPAMGSEGQAPLGPKYVGLWDFEARTAEELSFRAGDLFHVARKEEEWWWAVRLDGAGRALAEGYVPHNYLAEKETVESEL